MLNAITFSQEGLDGILMWGYWDQEHWRPEAAIATSPAVVPNKAGQAYQNIYHNFFRTNMVVENEAKTDDALEFNFRAFRGEYELSIIDENGGVVETIKKEFRLEDNLVIRRQEALR